MEHPPGPGSVSLRPDRDIEGVVRSHARLLETVAAIDDDTAARPSLLPGWDVAMLVTHLARNADSHVRAAEGAVAGECRPRYDSVAARAAGVEAGRGRPARALLDDLRSANERLETAWAMLPPEAWAGASLSPGGEREPLAGGPRKRWRESEVHHADLGLTFTPDDWDGTFVEAELDLWMGGLAPRLPAGAGASVTATDTGRIWTAGAAPVTIRVEAPARRVLAWLIGRGTDDFPAIAPWGF